MSLLSDMVKLLESLPAPLPKARLLKSDYITPGQVVRIPPSTEQPFITTVPTIIIHKEDAERLKREWFAIVAHDQPLHMALQNADDTLAGMIELYFQQLEKEKQQQQHIRIGGLNPDIIS